MNAVEIEEQVEKLVEAPFVRSEFPYAFLAAFGNKDTTLKLLRSGRSNLSDIEGAVLQRSNIHIAACASGSVATTLEALRNSPKTATAKAQFILATDGEIIQAEDLNSGEVVACDFAKLPDHFGFFLSLAGISTVKQIRESSFDIRATGRLNRLYVELLKDNREWASGTRRSDMNHFMARLIFCFFAEDTGIFAKVGLFTSTVETMSMKDSSNTHEVIGEIFKAMNVETADRETAKLHRWADAFPYVNGGLFSGSTEVPKFSRIARSYLVSIGNLDWKQINPDIFGSMIQAVADDEERGALGMHYTSVPNILKVLNPLFLDDLREKLAEAGDNSRTLLNLRKRIARIRVFDPACGSGNFLVIAYKEMRAIEAEINRRRGEPDYRTEIPITNYRGIELREFPAEIARLALIIAQYQCDVLYRGQREALAEFLPLSNQNWITCGNSLTLDWLSICQPNGRTTRIVSNDLFDNTLRQAEVDFEYEGGETFICGNPPYIGDKKQNKEQKQDMNYLFSGITNRWKSFDYVCAFFFKASEYIDKSDETSAAFVSTNSVCQGMQVAQFWPLILSKTFISFAVLSFKWSNLATNNAGVTCAIVGLKNDKTKILRNITYDSSTRLVDNISPYLTAGKNIFVSARQTPISELSTMLLGNVAKDGGNLIVSADEIRNLDRDALEFIRPIFGAQEFIKGIQRYCFWIADKDASRAAKIDQISRRFELVANSRNQSPKKETAAWSEKPYRFVEIRSPEYKSVIIIPRVTGEERPYLTVGLLPKKSIVTEAFAIYDAPLWNMAILSSRMHLTWVSTVCGQLETRLRYSNTLGWNTFPVPKLTEQNKLDLTRCAERILLARELHFPATIADIYDADDMPQNLRDAHEANDEIFERIYIGRRFRNDTERLEKLFELYTAMTERIAS
jgi:hypothetical protein